MATILVKNVPEGLLRDLKRLKAELGCRTWTELLGKLVESERTTTLAKERLDEMKAGVHGLLDLRSAVSSRWRGHPGVLEETRRSRNHDTA